MAKAIDRTRYNELKASAKANATMQIAAKREHVSVTTMNRVNKSKNYADFKAILVKDRGPNYAERDTKWPSRANKIKVTTQQEVPTKKPGFLRRVANFFDIPSRP